MLKKGDKLLDGSRVFIFNNDNVWQRPINLIDERGNARIAGSWEWVFECRTAWLEERVAELEKTALLNTHQAAWYLGISVHQMQTYVSRKKLITPYTKIGNVNMFTRQQLDEFNEKQRLTPGQKRGDRNG